MKKVIQSLSLDLVLQNVAGEFNLTQEEVHEIYLTILSNEAKLEASEAELEHYIHELFHVIGPNEAPEEIYEPESLSHIMKSSIYNLQSDEDTEKLKDIEEARLNEGSASIEDLHGLEAQAKTYFNNPSRYYLSEESDREPQVTCYVGIYSHTLYDLNNEPVCLYKATGVSFNLPLSEVMTLEGISKGVKSTGFEMDETIQVKVYGNCLYDLVGAKPYKDDESTEFVRFFEGCPNILLAIPDSEATCLRGERYSDSLDRLVKDEIMYGRSASEVLEGAYSQWILNQEFYEVRLPEIEEERLSLEHEKKLSVLINKKQEFRGGFAKEVEAINALNSKKCTLSDLSHLTAHEINRILFVCRSNDFAVRIQSKPIYMQLQAMAHKRSWNERPLFELQSSGSESAMRLIEYINGGGFVDIERLDFETLDEVFTLLWNKHSQTRILPKYKNTYFLLKDRYLSLKDMSALKAA